MKRLTLIAFVICSFCLNINAQNEIANNTATTQDTIGKTDCKKICQMKRQFIQDSLTLTDQEAAAFWALYDNTEAKEHEIHEKFFKFKETNKIESQCGRVEMNRLEPEKAMAMMEQKLLMKTEMQNLENSFFQNLKQILPAEKVVRYFHLDKQFKRKMVNGCKQRCGQALQTKKRR